METRQWLLVYEDIHGDTESLILITAMPPEVAIKTVVGHYRTIVCTEISFHGDLPDDPAGAVDPLRSLDGVPSPQ